MGMMRRKLQMLMLLWVLLGFVGSIFVFGEDEAYVTLLYGEEFVLGVRVLGKSIRDTGSTKDMVVLASDGVSSFSQMLLQADGWIVEHITLLENPNQIRPERFWGVYTKLKIFNMTRYKKVVYLDADTIVVKSIEELFKCGKFCANLKHSERLNSGVLVVEPSESLFLDMMAKVNTLPSYTGGDQGFLNSYYSGFANAHVFEPGSRGPTYSGPVPEMERLSTLYNADVGLYMLANKWMVDERELHIIHYTLGPLKPWDWWTAWLLKPVHLWQNVRETLEERVPGTGGGQNPGDGLTIGILFSLPFLVFLVAYHRQVFSWPWRNSAWDHSKRMFDMLRHGGAGGGWLSPYLPISSSSSSCLQGWQPWFLGAASVVACFVCAGAALLSAFFVVPRQVVPWTGLLLLYEWVFVIFFAVFKSFLHLVGLWGKRVASLPPILPAPTSHIPDQHRSDKDQKRRPGIEVEAIYWMGMAGIAVLIPSLPSLLGVTPLFSRLGLMVGGGVFLASFMTFASDRLSTLYFIRGAASARARSSFS